MKLEELEMLVKDQQAQIDYVALACNVKADPYKEPTQEESLAAGEEKARSHYELFLSSGGKYGWDEDKLRYANSRGMISDAAFAAIIAQGKEN